MESRSRVISRTQLNTYIVAAKQNDLTVRRHPVETIRIFDFSGRVILSALQMRRGQWLVRFIDTNEVQWQWSDGDVTAVSTPGMEAKGTIIHS